MTQLQQPVPTGALTPRGRFGTSTARPRLALAGIGLAMIMAASAIFAIALGRPPAAQLPDALAQGAVVDGWMPAISAANRDARIAAANAERDGWSSYLMTSDEARIAAANAERDGWSSYLPTSEEARIAAANAERDGWSSYLLTSE